MDNMFVSAALGVKISDLKKTETQIMQLEKKSNQALVEFLNHLQLGGDAEAHGFEELLLFASKKNFQEVFSVLDDELYYALDLAYADDILTHLNLKVNGVHYLDKFKAFDYLHISLKDLLDGDDSLLEERYQRLINEVGFLNLVDARKKEATLVKKYYDYLLERFGENTYLLAKINAINTRTLFRAKRLGMTESEVEDELIGDANTLEKFLSFYRLDDAQIAVSLRDKVEPQLSELFIKMTENRKNADLYFDEFLENKVDDLVFSDDIVDLLIVYVTISKRIIKYLKKVFYQVDNYEANRFN
jgi:hypothetical protein